MSDPLQRIRLGGPAVERRLVARLQHFFQALWSDPLAPTTHTALYSTLAQGHSDITISRELVLHFADYQRSSPHLVR